MATTACVIGAGPGGYVAAIRLAQLGVETTLVERDSRLGGVCLNRGCIPSKAYIQSAKLWEEIHHASEVGISVETPRLDLSATKEWKDGIVQRLTGGIAQLMKRNGVRLIRGNARFTSPSELLVEAEDAAPQTLRADHYIVATGSRPIEIPGFHFDEKSILSSTGALDLRKLPESLLVVGGGVIGLEIGQYLMKFGCELSVVELSDQLLPGTDPDLVKILGRKLRRQKATVHLKSKATSAQILEDGWVRVGIQTPKSELSIEVEKVLVCVGRRPNAENLGLEEAGVRTQKGGFIEVDRQLRSSNPKIFAIGDVAGPPLLAHKASKEGLVAAAVIAGQNDEMDATIPGAIFTDPEIASVGLSVKDAKDQGRAISVGSFPFTASGRALASRESDGMVKIIADAETDLILGVHIAGPHASELIAEATLAIEAGLCSEDLALTVHTHPTFAEALMEAAEDVHHLAVHIYNPAR